MHPSFQRAPRISLQSIPAAYPPNGSCSIIIVPFNTNEYLLLPAFLNKGREGGHNYRG